MTAADDSGALPEHAYYCFDVIDSKLNGVKPPLPSFDDTQQYPLFVTWNIVSRTSGDTRLRGCIGNFEAMAIGDGLKDYAQISAFKDHRFDPISAKELPRLECGVSLLTDFELCDNYLDWTIGTHGIYIQLPNPALAPTKPYKPPSIVPSLPASTATSSASSLSLDSTSTSSSSSAPRPSYRSISQLPPFVVSKSSSSHRVTSILSATYLPDVPGAQGWSKLEAVDSAIRKAGYSGKIIEELRKSLRVTRYQSKKVEVKYDEWKAWKDQEQDSDAARGQRLNSGVVLHNNMV